MHNSLTSWWT